MKKAAAYGRYSTDMQREESIDAQFRAIREYCQRNDILLISEYADEGISGTTDNRPQFQQMITDAQNGLFDYVIVHKLDRFSRSKYDSAIYKRKLKQSGVQLLSVLENLDGSPESIILESVLEGMSEYYSKNLSREVRKGLKENALKCKFNGGTPPLGYDIDENKDYVINEYEAEIVRLIFNMYLENYTYGEMSQKLNSQGYKTKMGKKFNKNSYYDILTNEKYIGTYVYSQKTRRRHHDKDMIKIENGMPAIIEKETWNEVQKMITDRQRPKKNENGRFYILTGLLFCGECDSPMNGQKRRNGKKNDYYYYRCIRNHKKGDCPAKSVRADKIEKQVLDTFNNIIFTESNKEKIIVSMIDFLISSPGDEETVTNLNKELNLVNEQIENIVNAIMCGVKSNTLKDKLKDLEDKKQGLIISLNKNKIVDVDTVTLEYKIRHFFKVSDNIYNYTPNEISLILKMFIERIEFKNGDITLKLKMMDFRGNAGLVFPHQLKPTQMVITLRVA